jgi:hypothetical protein
VLDKRDLRSRSKNTPFDEARLDGQVTIDDGGRRIVSTASAGTVMRDGQTGAFDIGGGGAWLNR